MKQNHHIKFEEGGDTYLACVFEETDSYYYVDAVVIRNGKYDFVGSLIMGKARAKNATTITVDEYKEGLNRVGWD